MHGLSPTLPSFVREFSAELQELSAAKNENSGDLLQGRVEAS